MLVLLVIIGLVIAAPQASVGAQTATPGATPGFVNPSPDPAAGDTGPVPAAAPYQLALLVPYPNDPFWQDVVNAVTARAVASGVTVDVRPLDPDLPSVPEQLSQIDEAIAAGVDGILIGPVDAQGVAPGIVAANRAGVPIIAIDVEPLGGEFVSFIRTDGVAATELAGHFLADELGGAGIVLNIQGDLASVPGQDRDQGLRKALDQYPAMSIVSFEGGWMAGNAAIATRGQLPVAGEGTPTAPLPLVNGIFAASPEMAHSAAIEVEEAKADTVVVVGFGASNDTLKDIQNGILAGVVAEMPWRAGSIALDYMVMHLNGETVPQIVDSGFTLVTAENRGEFIAANP